MTSSRFAGTTVSDGTASGVLYLADVPARAGASADEVAHAFAAVAADREALASQLRSEGREQEADIVAVAALIAADPVLVGPALDAVRTGTDAVTAVSAAAEAQASVLASLDSPELAERASDIRQIGRAVLERLAGGAPEPPTGDFILVRREVAAADLIELADEGLAGAVSVAGGASSHAAIIARGLGVPMLTAVDPAVLGAVQGRPALLNGVAGELTVEPTAAELSRVQVRAGTGARASTTGARTADGHEVLILCNVASAAETRRGLAAIDAITADLAVPKPRLGIMVELAATAAAAEAFAGHVDFLSIGTNDLAGQVLGLDRLDPSAGPGLAADPHVLGLIEHVLDAAAQAQIPVSVCGDSAADKRVLPLLIGLGIRVVSVPAASVSRVRQWISQLDTRACAVIAADALTSSSALENWELVRGADVS
jgi:phosphoenolpyruvate-protein kinase (PTS system EI component)